MPVCQLCMQFLHANPMQFLQSNLSWLQFLHAQPCGLTLRSQGRSHMSLSQPSPCFHWVYPPASHPAGEGAPAAKLSPFSLCPKGSKCCWGCPTALSMHWEGKAALECSRTQFLLPGHCPAPHEDTPCPIPRIQAEIHSERHHPQPCLPIASVSVLISASDTRSREVILFPDTPAFPLLPWCFPFLPSQTPAGRCSHSLPASFLLPRRPPPLSPLPSFPPFSLCFIPASTPFSFVFILSRFATNLFLSKAAAIFVLGHYQLRHTGRARLLPDNC